MTTTETAVTPEALPTATAMDVQPTARAHNIAVEFNKADVTAAFDGYWNRVKDSLNPELVKAAMKGGFRELRRDRVVDAAGGASKFYAPIIAEMVERSMESQERQALVVLAAKITETVTHFVVNAAVHLEPEVHWKKPIPGIDVPLEVRVPKLDPDLASKLADRSLQEAAELNAILTPLGDEVVGEDGQVAVVDVDSYIDGEVWEPGRATAKKWLLDRAVHRVPELYSALIGMQQGTTKELSFVLSDKFGDMSGKTVNAKLRLIQLYSRKPANIDDDLAKSNGHDTIDAYRTMFKNEADDNIKRSSKGIVDSGIYASLLDVDIVDVDPIPYAWMASKGNEIYAQARAMVETDQQLLEQFKDVKDASGNRVVEDKSDAVAYIAQQAARSLITDLVLRSWGKKKGIVGPTKLADMSDYVRLVRAEIEKVVVKVEVDLNEGVNNASV